MLSIMAPFLFPKLRSPYSQLSQIATPKPDLSSKSFKGSCPFGNWSTICAGKNENDGADEDKKQTKKKGGEDGDGKEEKKKEEEDGSCEKKEKRKERKKRKEMLGKKK